MKKYKILTKTKLIQIDKFDYIAKQIKIRRKVNIHSNAVLVFSTDISIASYINREKQQRKRRKRLYKNKVKSLKSRGILYYADPSVL